MKTAEKKELTADLIIKGLTSDKDLLNIGRSIIIAYAEQEREKAFEAARKTNFVINLGYNKDNYFDFEEYKQSNPLK